MTPSAAHPGANFQNDISWLKKSPESKQTKRSPHKAKSDHPPLAGLEHFPGRVLLHAVYHRNIPQPANNIPNYHFIPLIVKVTE